MFFYNQVPVQVVFYTEQYKNKQISFKYNTC